MPAPSATLQPLTVLSAKLLLLCSLFVSSSAFATIEYAFQGGASWYQFDNPYLFGKDDARRVSSSATSTDIGAAVFIPFPTDRTYLLLSGSASKIKMDSLKQLDHTKKQWDALYQWEFSSFLRGKFSHRDDQRMYDYYDGLADGRVDFNGNGDLEPVIEPRSTNLELPHIKDTQAEIALRVTPRFDIPVTFARQSMRYIDPYDITPFSSNTRSQKIAIRYESGTKSTLSAGIKRSNVHFPLRTDNEQIRYDTGYRDRELFLDTAWRYTENTIILAHLGTVQRKFDTLHNRNLRALELGADWHYSVKTWFTLRLWDRPENIDDSGRKLFLQVRGAQVRMMWESTPKTRFAFLTSIEQERYQEFNNRTTATQAQFNSENKLLRLGVRFDYDITPRLNLRLEANHRRDLVSGPNNHHNGVVHASIRYSFENLTNHNRARVKLDNLR